MSQQKISLQSKGIFELLEIYSNTEVKLQQYCCVCQKALTLTNQQLMQAYQSFNKQQQHKKYASLLKFLLHPKIKFNSHHVPQIPIDTKKKETLNNLGKRIQATICYAWDYYIRLIKTSEEKKSSVYTEDSIRQAKKNIESMLKELRDKNYMWELFDKEEITNQQQIQKEIEQERNFVNLLDNMLKSQTIKVLKARQNHPQLQKEQPLPERQSAEAYRQNIETPLSKEQASQNGRIQQLINIKGYFESKKKLAAEKQPLRDPIAVSEEKRRFNAAVLRFMMNNTEAEA